MTRRMNTFRKALQGESDVVKERLIHDEELLKGGLIGVSNSDRRKMYKFYSALEVANDLRTRTLKDARSQVLLLHPLYYHVKRKLHASPEYVAAALHKHGWVLEEVDYPWVKAWGQAWEKKYGKELNWSYANGATYPLEVVIYPCIKRDEQHERALEELQGMSVKWKSAYKRYRSSLGLTAKLYYFDT